MKKKQPTLQQLLLADMRLVTRHLKTKRRKSKMHNTMSRARYRRRLVQLGLIEKDQDVFHIIAVSNGGVDHPDNYHYAQNSSHNRSIGCRYDHVNCYMAGLAKARKAVSICRKIGHYRGPTAATLYRMGARFWKQAKIF